MQFSKLVKALNSQFGFVRVLYTVLAILYHLGAVRGARRGAVLPLHRGGGMFHIGNAGYKPSAHEPLHHATLPGGLSTRWQQGGLPQGLSMEALQAT